MNTDLGVEWTEFAHSQFEDVQFAFGVLDETAQEPPPGHMLNTIEQVLTVHPMLGPMLISRYAQLLTESERQHLAARFESVKTFLETYSQYVAALTA